MGSGPSGSNCVHRLRCRELGLFRCQTRLVWRIVRSLVVSPTRCFGLETYSSFSGKVAFENRRYYTDHCRQVCSVDELQAPSALYRLDWMLGEKFEDALLFEYPLLDRARAPKWFIGLTNKNRILILDAKRGELCRTLKLPQGCQFKSISWAQEAETFYVTGRTLPGSPLQSTNKPDRVLVVFDVFPLTFVGTIHLLSSVFGNIREVWIFHDLLGVSLVSPSVTKLYSLRTIWNQFMDGWHQLEELPVGCPLPINVPVTRQPSALFQVAHCVSNSFEIGGFPWHCLSLKNGTSTYRLFPLSSPETFLETTMLKKRPDSEQDAFFHPDESGRILHLDDANIRCYKLSAEDSQNRRLVLEWTGLGETKTADIEQTSFTQSGRQVRRRVSAEKLFLNQRLEGASYDAELDILMAIVIEQPDEGEEEEEEEDLKDRVFKATVVLLDNDSGRCLKRVSMEEGWKLMAEHQCHLDLDVLVHMVQVNNTTQCFLHRLQEQNQADLDTILDPSSKRPKNKLRRSQRRKP